MWRSLRLLPPRKGSPLGMLRAVEVSCDLSSAPHPQIFITPQKASRVIALKSTLLVNCPVSSKGRSSRDESEEFQVSPETPT